MKQCLPPQPSDLSTSALSHHQGHLITGRDKHPSQTPLGFYLPADLGNTNTTKSKKAVYVKPFSRYYPKKVTIVSPMGKQSQGACLGHMQLPKALHCSGCSEGPGKAHP